MKHWLKDYLPPALLRLIRRLRHQGIYFSGPYAQWESAQTDSHGYDQDAILEKVLVATRTVLRGEAAFERDSVLFTEPEYNWPVLTALLCAANFSRGKLNVLDFGGALGSCYFQSRPMLEGLSELVWNVVEQAHFSDCGRRHIECDELQFHDSIPSALLRAKPDAILLSGTLQYLPDPVKTLDDLASIGAEYMILDRTTVNQGPGNILFVQHVPASIYPASYPCWSLSEGLLMDCLTPRYILVSDFQSLKFPALADIGAEFKGYVFRKVH